MSKEERCPSFSSNYHLVCYLSLRCIWHCYHHHHYYSYHDHLIQQAFLSLYTCWQCWQVDGWFSSSSPKQMLHILGILNQPQPIFLHSFCKKRIYHLNNLESDNCGSSWEGVKGFRPRVHILFQKQISRTFPGLRLIFQGLQISP